MTRTITIIFAVVVIAWGTAPAAIDKSKHDIPFYFGQGVLKEVNASEACTYCHHPTNGEVSTELAWEGADPNVTPNSQFAVYYSEKGDEMLICRSCHDGVTVLDIFSNNPGSDHPVGFDYVELSFHERRYPYYDYKLGGVKGPTSGQVYPMKNSMMQCTTCHDPHEGESHFVRGGKDFLSGSVMCLDCHSCISDDYKLCD